MPGDQVMVCDASPTAVTLKGGLQTEVFDLCKSCHIAGVEYGNFTTPDETHKSVGRAATYAARTSGSSLKVIDTASLANSALWLKVNGGSPKHTGPKGEDVSTVMPPAGPTLTDAQLKSLKDWICTGAKLE